MTNVILLLVAGIGHQIVMTTTSVQMIIVILLKDVFSKILVLVAKLITNVIWIIAIPGLDVLMMRLFAAAKILVANEVCTVMLS
jgi:hypothetical protein